MNPESFQNLCYKAMVGQVCLLQLFGLAYCISLLVIVFPQNADNMNLSFAVFWAKLATVMSRY